MLLNFFSISFAGIPIDIFFKLGTVSCCGVVPVALKFCLNAHRYKYSADSSSFFGMTEINRTIGT